MSWLHDQQKRERWVRFIQSLGPNVDPKALRLMDEIVYVSRAIYHVGGQSIDEAGLSYAQYRVLMHLLFAENMGERSELTPSEISERQGVSRNTMSALIRNLEEEGLVLRRLDNDDRRRFNISLTDTGRELVRQYARQHLEMVGHCFSALSDAEQETLVQLLSRVGQHVTAVRDKQLQGLAVAHEP